MENVASSSPNSSLICLIRYPFLISLDLNFFPVDFFHGRKRGRGVPLDPYHVPHFFMHTGDFR